MTKIEKSNDILDLIHKMGGYLDENGMLQLKNGFFAGEQVPPHGIIFQNLASYMEKTYGETGLDGLSTIIRFSVHMNYT